MIGDTATRVLLAVVNQRRPTVRSVAREVGCAINTAHKALYRLRAEGLVTWDANKQATLRPLIGLAQTFDSPADMRYNPGRHTSGPGAALTARDLADTTQGGADMADVTEAAPSRRDGRR